MSDAFATAVAELAKTLPRDLAPNESSFRIELREISQLDSPESVWTALISAGEVEGWLLLTDRVVRVERGTAIENAESVPLEAELAIAGRDGDESLHLRHLSGLHWELRRLARVSDDSSVGTRRYFFQDGDPRRRLVYEIGWTLVADPFGERSLAPTLARFAGFDRS